MRAGPLECSEQQRLGVAEAALQPGDVAEPDRDPHQAQVIGHLEEDVLRLPIVLLGPCPFAALLVHDPQMKQRRPGLGKASQAPEALQRAAEVRARRLPLAQVLEDQPEVVADSSGARLVAEPPVERQRLLVHVAGGQRVPLAVRDATHQVETRGRKADVPRLVRQREGLRGALARLFEAGELEQRLGASLVQQGANRQGVDLRFAPKDLAAMGERGGAVAL